MAVARTLLLVCRDDVLEYVLELIGSLPWARGRGLEVDLLQGDLAQAMAERRDFEGNIPIGVLVDDEVTALAVLAAGADEAAALLAITPQTLAAFVDRVEFRARNRVENHRLHESFAHAEKLTALGTLVAGVGHEINNPLSAVLLLIEAGRRQILPTMDAAWELARALEKGDDLPEHALSTLRSRARAAPSGVDAGRIFEEIGSAADAIASIVSDLRVFARTDEDELPEVVAVPSLIDQTIRLLGRDMFKRCLLERDYASDVPSLVVPRNRVTQVLMNLLVNATHAIAEIERPVHRISISARADEEFVAIAISDTGAGIPPKSIERIFDPFFTTKRQEMGTGLGLSISRSIARRLGGELSVESVYGEGATFVCLLPLPSPDMLRDAMSRSRKTVRPVPAIRSARVLVVDDDVHMLRSYARLLSTDHRLLVAHDGRDAIDLLESGSVADVAIVELDLSDVGGAELIQWLRVHRPGLADRTLVVTGAATRAEHAEFLRTHRGPVLYKPVHGGTLLRTIQYLCAPVCGEEGTRSAG